MNLRRSRRSPRFSEKVLLRRSRRRERLISLISLVTLIAAITISATLTSITAYREHRAKLYQLQLNALPDWASLVKMQQPGLIATWNVMNPAGLPNELFINGDRWSLQEVAEFPEHQNWGAVTFCEQKVIFYKSITVPSGIMREDLMHEIFHAGACGKGDAKYWNSDDELTHEGIYHLGSFMAEFLHENPEMAGWFR